MDIKGRTLISGGFLSGQGQGLALGLVLGLALGLALMAPGVCVSAFSQEHTPGTASFSIPKGLLRPAKLKS